jgi:hypothetical protein
MVCLFWGDCHEFYSRHEIPPYISLPNRQYSKSSSPSFIFFPHCHLTNNPLAVLIWFKNKKTQKKTYNTKNDDLTRTLGFLSAPHIFLGTAPYGQHCIISVIEHLTPNPLAMSWISLFHLQAKHSSSYIIKLYIIFIYWPRMSTKLSNTCS